MMNNCFNMLPKAKCTIIKKDGTSFNVEMGYTNNSKFYVLDSEVQPYNIEFDDIIKAEYKNKTVMEFIVVEPGYYPQTLINEAHYQISIKKLDKNQENKTININNSDNSILVINNNSPNSNISINQDLSVFDDIKRKIEISCNIENSEKILQKLSELKESVNNKKTFSEKYAEFIAVCANHMTLIQPFIPFLSKFF